MRNSSLYHLIIGFISLFACCLLYQVVSAKNPYVEDDYIELTAVRLANEVLYIAEEKLEPSKASSAQALHYDLIDAVLRDQRNILTSKSEQAIFLNTQHVEYFQAYMDLFNLSTQAAVSTNDYTFIKSGLENTDWQVRHLSALLLAVIHLKASNAVEALLYAEKSLSEIPTESNSTYTAERFYTYWVLYMSFVVDGDLNRAFSNIEQMLVYSKLSGRRANEFDVINNMAVMLDKSGDLDTAIKLTSIMTKRAAVTDDMQNKFIANFSHGRFLLKADRYSQALLFLEQALKVMPQDFYEAYIHVDLATAYAKLGKYQEAEHSIRYLNSKDLGNSIKYAKRHLDQPKALIAASNGDYEIAFNLIREYSDQQIQFYKEGLSSDRRDANRRVLLSQEIAEKNLEKAELQAKLAAETLAKQKAKGRLYQALIAIGFVLVVSSGLFLRRLSKLNKRLKCANEEIVEKSKIKTDLLAMFSHEMLTPLNGIVPLADILQRQETDLKKKKLLKMIETSGAELTQKMKDIILVANPHDQTSCPVSVHVENFLREILTQYQPQTQKETSLTVQMGCGMPEQLEFDVDRLRAAISALLSNAVKYTTEGEIVLSCHLNMEGHLVIDVMDSGQGIDASKLGDMTKPFGQSSLSISRDNQGLGLGLTIVQLQCLIIGASFQMESEIGMGTTARLILPLNQNRALQDDQAKQAA